VPAGNLISSSTVSKCLQCQCTYSWIRCYQLWKPTKHTLFIHINCTL